ncbi:hypothetical protein Tco_0759686 [Tanacetum coccineum]
MPNIRSVDKAYTMKMHQTVVLQPINQNNNNNSLLQQPLFQISNLNPEVGGGNSEWKFKERRESQLEKMVLLEYFHQYLLQKFMLLKRKGKASEHHTYGKSTKEIENNFMEWMIAKVIWEKPIWTGLKVMKFKEDAESVLKTTVIRHFLYPVQRVGKRIDRSLPSAWSNLAMTMRTKPDVDTLSIDDLYNNLRVFEQELTSTSKSSASAQNSCFCFQLQERTEQGLVSGHTALIAIDKMKFIRRLDEESGLMENKLLVLTKEDGLNMSNVTTLVILLENDIRRGQMKERKRLYFIKIKELERKEEKYLSA